VKIPLKQYAAGVKIAVVQAEKKSMGSRITKFIQRAPRYTLSPNDNRILRFAHKDDPGHSFTTRFLDISETGLAFVTDADHAPHISDLIKVEFPVGDVTQIAWWARVVRVEEYATHKWYMKKEDFNDGHQVRVAIMFHDLPAGHSTQIRQSLNKKFTELSAARRKESWKNFVVFLFDKAWKIALYSALFLGTIWLLYFLSQPDLNYDPKKGAPWGERYPSLMLPPEKNK
jgi:hypothetical protein